MGNREPTKKPASNRGGALYNPNLFNATPLTEEVEVQSKGKEGLTTSQLNKCDADSWTEAPADQIGPVHVLVPEGVPVECAGGCPVALKKCRPRQGVSRSTSTGSPMHGFYPLPAALDARMDRQLTGEARE